MLNFLRAVNGVPEIQFAKSPGALPLLNSGSSAASARARPPLSLASGMLISSRRYVCVTQAGPPDTPVEERRRAENSSSVVPGSTVDGLIDVQYASPIHSLIGFVDASPIIAVVPRVFVGEHQVSQEQ